MANTRRGASLSLKEGRGSIASTYSELPRELPASDAPLSPDGQEMINLLAGLSEESKSLVKIFPVVIPNQSKTDVEATKAESLRKDLKNLENRN